MKNLSQTLIKFLKNAPRPVVLHEPFFSTNDRSYVDDCISSGWVSSVGSYVDQFQEKLSQYTDAYAVPVVNGTAALHLALIVAGVKPGDEVFVPDLTFVATANSVHYCHATPHFVEVERDSYGIDPKKLESYILTLDNVPKFLVVTHIFGNPARIIELRDICEKYGITIVEDAAESLGSWVDNKHTGTFGKVAALSFNGNKIITTGGGGAVLTTDSDLADRIKHLSTTAKTNDPYSHRHDEIGYNYRMPNLNAALGCSQLEKLPEYLDKKNKLFDLYRDMLEGFEDIDFIKPVDQTVSNHWLNNILMPNQAERNHIIETLAEEKILCRGLWAPMSSLPMYSNCPKMPTPVTYDLCNRTVSLPSSPMLSQYVNAK